MIVWGVEQKDALIPYYTSNDDFAILCVQNRSYEDRFTVMHNNNITYYGVFDGHGDLDKKTYKIDPAHVVLYLRDNLHNHIAERLGSQPDKLTDLQIKEIITKTFRDVDKYMFDNGGKYGSTCCIIIIIGRRIVIASTGDSKAILYKPTEHFTTLDHKPQNESKRVIDAGGWVSHNRVCGTLAMSRAFGDYEYKLFNNQYTFDGCVIVQPDVTIIPIDGDMKFILATDGLFDGFSSVDEVVEMAKSLDGNTHGKIVNDLYEYARWSNGNDDCTIIHGNIH